MKTLLLAIASLFLVTIGKGQMELNSQPQFTFVKTIKPYELPKGVVTNYYKHSELGYFNIKKRKFESKYGIGMDLIGGYTITTSDNYIVINSPGYRESSITDTNAYVLFSIADEWNYRTRVLDGSVCSCSKLKSMYNDGTNVQNDRRELCYTSENVPVMWSPGNDNKRKGKYEWRTHYFVLYK